MEYRVPLNCLISVLKNFMIPTASLLLNGANRLAPGELAEDLAVSISTVDDLTRTFILFFCGQKLFFCGREKSNLINLLKKTFEILNPDNQEP